MNRSRLTFQKREREKAKRERRQQKIARRAEVKAQRATAPAASVSGDPDLAGITPGPQPRPWDD